MLLFLVLGLRQKVQNRIKRRRETLPLLMLRPFENLLAMRRAARLQGRITEQRDGGIWNEVWELHPSSLLSFFILTAKPLKCFPYHQILLCWAASLFDPSCPWRAVCWWRIRWRTRFIQEARAARGTFIHQGKVQSNRGRERKLDEWLITSRREMIHHILELSSLKTCQWAFISVSYSR